MRSTLLENMSLNMREKAMIPSSCARYFQFVKLLAGTCTPPRHLCDGSGQVSMVESAKDPTAVNPI